MTRNRRTLMLPALAAGMTLEAPTFAQTYPDRAVTIVVSYPPGGDTDAMARLYAEKLAARLKQPVIVDNKPGAGGTLGNTAALRAKPDGYTLLFTPNPDKTFNRSATDYFVNGRQPDIGAFDTPSFSHGERYRDTHRPRLVRGRQRGTVRLSLILSYTDLAVADLHTADPLRAYLQEVLAAAHRAEGLTRQLLAFSRKQVLNPEPTALSELLALNQADLHEIAENEGVEGSENARNRRDLIFSITSARLRARVPVVVDGVFATFEGHGFLRSSAYDYLPSADDVFVPPSLVQLLALQPCALRC